MNNIGDVEDAQGYSSSRNQASRSSYSGSVQSRQQGSVQSRQQGSMQSRQGSLAPQQGLQRSFQKQSQSPGLQRSFSAQQARSGVPPPNKDFDGNESRRRTIICCLVITVILVIVFALLLAVVLGIWLSDDTVTEEAPRDRSGGGGDFDSPTSSPASASSLWEIRSELSTDNGEEVRYGADVVIAGELMIVGVPGYDSSAGRVEIYESTGSNANATNLTFSLLSVASASNTEDFGEAVAFAINPDGVPNLLVGAKRSVGELQPDVGFGTAHFFRYDGVSWEQVGDDIRGLETVEEAGGLLGAAVAMASSADRIAVASPSSSLDSNNYNTGRVYTFQLNGATWDPMTSSPLQGDAESFFGHSIDMSEEGNNLLVGAPGVELSPQNGKAVYYAWSAGSNSWVEVFEVEGTDGESLGSAVAILTPDGTQFAIGSQNMNDGSGGIRVFGLNVTTGNYEQLGDDILGQSGEQVGASLGGRNGTIAIGTDTGRVRVYEYDGVAWNQLGNSPNAGSAIRSIAISEDTDAIAVGTVEGFVIVYGQDGA